MNAVDLHACMVVSSPEWNDGRPVRIQSAQVHAGRVAVRWQDARCCGSIHARVVDMGMELDLVSGGCLNRTRYTPVLTTVPTEDGGR